MNWRSVHTIARVAFAALAVTAIVAQILDLVDRGVFNPINSFSFFTIQSNLIGVAALLLAAATAGRRQPWMDSFRGAATVYMIVTFIVFALLLADTDVDTALVWVDRTLHRVMPIVLAADWLLEPPAQRMRIRRQIPVWLAYPAAWVVYTLVRGAISGWYPYPFLDPGLIGYGGVLAYSGAILLGMIGAIALVVLIGNGMRGRRGGD